jgi:hypothetical protein
MNLLNLKPSKDVALALKWLLENHEHSDPQDAETALIQWWGSRE